MSGGEGKPWNGPLDTGNNGAKAMIQSGYNECLCNTHVYMERRKMDDCVLCERESGMKG